MDKLQDKWDARYRDAADDSTAVARVLAENSHLIAGDGSALDLACGLGVDACFLARLGLTVTAWDISPVAIDRLAQRAARDGLQIHAQVRDVVQQPPTAASFDLILVSHFLERSLAPAIESALRPGGLLFYQTFSRFRVDTEGPSNPDYLLDDNELLNLFPRLRPRVYREELQLGQLNRGWRNRVMLVAQQP